MESRGEQFDSSVTLP
nr:unnamed protein product [Callosobruchus chinensis]